MATTTKFDTSAVAVANLDLPADFWPKLGGKSASRWGGVYKPRWECWTFSVKLPRDVEPAMTLRLAVLSAELNESLPWGAVRKPLRTLARHLEVALGWPDREPSDQTEHGLRLACCEQPADLAHWSAYADWLQEHGHKQGLVMARWLSPKTFSQKAAREERWEECRQPVGPTPQESDPVREQLAAALRLALPCLHWSQTHQPGNLVQTAEAIDAINAALQAHDAQDTGAQS